MLSSAANPSSLGYELDAECAIRKCRNRMHLDQPISTDLSVRVESAVTNNISSTLKSAGDIASLLDPVLEQIERNRKIIEQLSPVLKYKEMMRKRRARAIPRRKFSIAQGYPRFSRWKGSTTSRCDNYRENYNSSSNSSDL